MRVCIVDRVKTGLPIVSSTIDLTVVNSSKSRKEIMIFEERAGKFCGVKGKLGLTDFGKISCNAINLLYGLRISDRHYIRGQSDHTTIFTMKIDIL